MKKVKVKQVLLSIFLIAVIALIIWAVIYIRKNPINMNALPVKKKSMLMTGKTYIPYEPSEQSQTSAAGTANKPDVSAKGDEGASDIKDDSAAILLTLRYPDPITRFYTTKRANIFTFSGLGNFAEVTEVLSVLRSTGSTATFFVTQEELETKGELIRLIKSWGNSLGISMRPDAFETVEEMKEALLNIREILTDAYKCTEKLYIRPVYYSDMDILMAAAAACDMEIMTQYKEVVTDMVSRMTNVEDAFNAAISPKEGMFQRGEIIHFQMDYMQYGDRLLSQLVQLMIRRQCPYPVMAADAVAADTSKLYTYPLPEDAILPEVKDKIWPGHLSGYTNEMIMDVIANGYLGIDWVNTRHFLPGFEVSEIRRMNKKGLIDNTGNFVFLTFDDWGTDGTVDRLLQVLKKHGATATFFVRTEYVPYNPNLLRAIAEEGHTIADHSHRHIKLSNEVTATEYAELTQEQVDILRDDLVTSYQVLQSIVGDLRDPYGKPSLSTLFRPPTMAVSKSGLTTVFDVGYTHSISGFYSMRDYSAEDPRLLADLLKRKIRSGAVLVMHFSDTAIYTAEALDICLSELEAEGKYFTYVGLNAVY